MCRLTSYVLGPCAGAELLTWVLQKPIPKSGAMRCAKREPGRSWEAIESELKKLGALAPCGHLSCHLHIAHCSLFLLQYLGHCVMLCSCHRVICVHALRKHACPRS